MKALHIAVGLLQDSDGRILVSQRRPGTHGEGRWEFPGGKCEDGEAVGPALRRELLEELGISVLEARPFITVRHAYPQREVVLDTWLVTAWSGDVAALEGQPLAWVPIRELDQWPLLEADLPIVRALELPDFYLFTGDAAPDRFLQQLAASLDAGVRLVRLRAHHLDDTDYARLAADCISLCRRAGARLLLDRSPEMVIGLKADGIHLTSQGLAAATHRLLPEEYWLAASCHTADELQKLQDIGGDFGVLSPVKPTPGHSESGLLGWPKFREIVRGRPLPVFALGGLVRTDLPDAWSCGARGIAAIRGLWGKQG